MDNELVIVTREGQIATVTINRPDKMNALSAATLAQRAQAFTALAADAPRAAILTGAGDRAFVAGADIAEMSEMTTAKAKRFADAGHALCALIESLAFPVIAAVNGVALGGGCELALEIGLAARGDLDPGGVEERAGCGDENHRD